MKTVIWNKEQVKNWFGDRGYPFDDDAKLTYKVINNKWIFIHSSGSLPYDDFYDDVELFYLKTLFCEPENCWKKDGFDWSIQNLLELLPT